MGRLRQLFARADAATGVDAVGAEDAIRLGNACLQGARGAEAVAWYRHAIAEDPLHAAAHICLGHALRELGDTAKAEAALKQALALAPRNQDVHYLLAALATETHNDALAAIHLRTVLDIAETFAPAYLDLARALFRMGEAAQGLDCMERGIGHFPQAPDFHFYRSNLLLALGRSDEAAAGYQQTLALDPNHAAAMAGLANYLGQRRQTGEAIRHLRRALELEPGNAAWHSDLLFNLQYEGRLTAGQLFEEHRQFGVLQEQPLAAQGVSQVRVPFDPGRRLRIGYVSGDFRTHSLSFFIEPVLRLHHRDKVEIYCYYTYSLADEVTHRLREWADHWRDCAALDDDAMARRIAQDGIDVLVDLSGHTAYNRLPVFARKPAPVQMTWLGYQASTGLSSMDYRITDAVLDPPGTTEHYHSEKLLRLEVAGIFQPYAYSPEVNALPCLSEGVFTFGCLNNPAKITPDFLDAAAQIMLRTTRTRLLLGGLDAPLMPKMLDALQTRGVPAERVHLVGKLPLEGYLKLHHGIDVALDTFPYNGGTTTLHSLWMGVPIVALDGTTPISRVGASLMRGMHFHAFACDSLAAYVDQAVALHGNTAMLQATRAVLRARVSTWLAGTGERFVGELEANLLRIRLQADSAAQ